MARSAHPGDAEADEPKLKTRQRKADEPKKPPKVDYKQLAEALCDQVIDATEGHPSTARFPVCNAALKYAVRLIGRHYVKRTSRSAA